MTDSWVGRILVKLGGDMGRSVGGERGKGQLGSLGTFPIDSPEIKCCLMIRQTFV